MANVEKKIWPDYFKKVHAHAKNIELRLADFTLKKGDILVLKEWNPRNKRYTGRSVRRRVTEVHRLNIFKFYPAKKIRKYGLYLIKLY